MKTRWLSESEAFNVSLIILSSSSSLCVFQQEHPWLDDVKKMYKKRSRSTLKSVAINHKCKSANKVIKMTLRAWTVLSSLSSLVCAYKTGCLWRGEKWERESEKEKNEIRREQCNAPVQGRGAWDVQMKWEALSRRLLLSMKAEAAPCLMRGEV